MIETIKEYLISLGFKTDSTSLNTAQAAMKKAESSVDSFAGSSVKNFAKSATAVVSFVATANIALGKYLVSLAQSDLQTEMFARRMWMGKDAAKAYQASIDALGVSVNDLYLSPELMDKYLELNRQALDMGVPIEEYSKQMQGVRDITFEFQRLKLEGTYTLQWVGYYLTKYLSGPLGDSRDWLRKINDEIQDNMPKWSKKIAEVASWAVRLGEAAWYIRDGLGAALGVLAGFKMVSMLTNPLGLLILGMTALLLLVDDFKTYTSGGESAFPELWKSLDDKGTIKKFIDNLHKVLKVAKDFGGKIGKYLDSKEFKEKLNGLIQDLKKFESWLEKIGHSKTFQRYLKDTKDLVVTLGNGVENTWNWLVKLYKKLEDNGDLVSFANTFVDAHGSVIDLVNAIGDLLNALDGKGGLSDTLSSGIISGLEKFRDVMESIAGLVTIVAGGIKGLSTGDFSNMKKGLDMFLDGVPKGLMKESPQETEAKKRLKEREDKVDEYNKGADKGMQDFFGGIGAEISNLRSKIFSKDTASDNLSQSPKVGQVSYETNQNHQTTNNYQTIQAPKPIQAPMWSPLKDSIPETDTGAPSIDWGTLKIGLMDLLDSIRPKSVTPDQSNNTTQNHYLTENTHNQTTENSHYYSESKPDPTPVWSSFKDSIPGANTEASTVDWSALKKGFVSFMNSIPKEFGDISKGLFQTAKSYGGSSPLVGAGGSMNYLYPQSNTSNMSQVAVKQTYNIYGAKDPQSVATTINRTSTSSLTRHFQGVNR